jgi:hypothetical protein
MTCVSEIFRSFVLSVLWAAPDRRDCVTSVLAIPDSNLTWNVHRACWNWLAGRLLERGVILPLDVA